MKSMNRKNMIVLQFLIKVSQGWHWVFQLSIWLFYDLNFINIKIQKIRFVRILPRMKAYFCFI